MPRGLGLVALAVGCGEAGDAGRSDPGPPGDTDTDPPTGAITGDTGSVPTAIEVACSPTANALRFTCAVHVDPAQGVEVTFERADGTGQVRLQRAPRVEADHEVPLWFLAPGTAYRVEARGVRGGASDPATTTLTTGAAPVEVDSALAVTGRSSTPYVGTNVPCSPNSAVAGVWDTATGELVWYQLIEAGGHFGGYEMIRFTEDHTILGLTGQSVVEVDLLGADRLRVPYTAPFHHDLFRRDGLTWVLFQDPQGGGLMLDGFVVWDSSGTELARFRQSDVVDLPPTVTGDWSHTNTVYVDADHQVWLSLLTQNSLVKVDGDPASATFGALEWVLAGKAPAGLGQDFAVDWSAVPGNDTFSHQHDATLRPDGRLSLLDNDGGRALVLSLDEAGRTAAVDEAYPADRSICGPQGTATTTARGHTLVACSGAGLLEYEPGGSTPSWSGVLSCANGTFVGGPPGPGASFGAVRWYPLDDW